MLPAGEAHPGPLRVVADRTRPGQHPGRRHRRRDRVAAAEAESGTYCDSIWRYFVIASILCVMASIWDRSFPRADASECTRDKRLSEQVHDVLPRAASLIAAFPAVSGRGHAGQLVIDSGHRLAVQHQQQWSAEDASRADGSSAEIVASCKRLIDDLNAQRVRLVEQIDDWIAREICGRADASLHTETFGSVVDRLAIAWVRANSLRGAGAGGRARLALLQLTELAAAYDDLVRDVALGRRRLPYWRSLKDYRGAQ